MKPNNILIDYHEVTDRECIIDKVMVGDVDNAVVLEAGQFIPCQVSNVW